MPTIMAIHITIIDITAPTLIPLMGIESFGIPLMGIVFFCMSPWLSEPCIVAMGSIFIPCISRLRYIVYDHANMLTTMSDDIMIMRSR